MESDSVFALVEKILKPFSEVINQPDPNRIDVSVIPQKLKSAVKALFDANWGYLSAITGVDHPQKSSPDAGESNKNEEGHIEVMYHFCKGAVVLSLRVMLPYAHVIVPTICDLIPSATLYERELIEMFGVTIEGTPNPSRLLIPDEWPEGIYPLRKSFIGLSNPKKS